MTYTGAMVVDERGLKVEFVAVDKESNPDETRVAYYTLKEGERLIEMELGAACAMLKPRWTGEGWEETASKEELAERERERQEASEAVNYDEFVAGLMEGYTNG